MRLEHLLLVVVLIALAQAFAARAGAQPKDVGGESQGRPAAIARNGAATGNATAPPRSARPVAAPLAVRDLLVRTALAESRWSMRDAGIQWHVLQRWALRLGVSLADAIKLRVWRFSRRPPRWITRVTSSCVEPSGWPARLSWGAHSDRCWAYYAAADAFLRGELVDECPAARGWRAPGAAYAAALDLGRKPVRCGRTKNRYVR